MNTRTQNNDFMQTVDEQQIISFLNFKHFYLFVEILFLAEYIHILFFFSIRNSKFYSSQVRLFFVFQLNLFITIFMLFIVHGSWSICWRYKYTNVQYT